MASTITGGTGGVSINSAAVRKLAMPDIRARRLAENTEIADAQRMTVRCDECGWYMRDMIVADGKRAFEAHLSGKRHTGQGRKSGPQAKTRDRLAGRSWAK